MPLACTVGLRLVETAYERNVGRCAVPPLAHFGERVWWMPLQPSNCRLGLWIHDLNKEGTWRPMDGSNTVLVEARTIKRLSSAERWTGSLLDEALGSEFIPNALEDDGGRVGIRAPVSQPHEAVLLPPLVPEFRQVRRAPLRRTDFERFGYTDNCPGCAPARAGRKQAVDHSEHCRSRMETILSTTTEGHDDWSEHAIVLLRPPRNGRMRTLSARGIALRVKGCSFLRGPVEGSSKSSRSGSALPPAPPPPPLEPPPVAKRSLEQETEMTDATVQQQGESKRRRERPEVPQAAGSRSSSSSESSTDTEMGLVDVCTIHCDNSKAEGRCEGGPITLDLTKWVFDKAHGRNKCRKLVENSKPLLLIGSPIDSGGGDKERARGALWHSSASCTKHNCTGVGISFTHTHILQTVGNSQQL